MPVTAKRYSGVHRALDRARKKKKGPSRGLGVSRRNVNRGPVTSILMRDGGRPGPSFAGHTARNECHLGPLLCTRPVRRYKDTPVRAVRLGHLVSPCSCSPSSRCPTNGDEDGAGRFTPAPDTRERTRSVEITNTRRRIQVICTFKRRYIATNSTLACRLRSSSSPPRSAAASGFRGTL